MIKPTIKHSLLIILIPLAIVTGLTIRYRIRQAPLEKFERKILTQTLVPLSTVRASVQRYAGADEGYYYFTGVSPEYLLRYDHHLKQVDRLDLGITSDRKMRSRFYAIVESGSVSLFAGNAPAIIQNNLSIPSKGTRFTIDEGVFSRISSIDDSTFIARGYLRDSGLNQLFYRYNTRSRRIEKQNQVFEQTDAGLSSDGLLHYDRRRQQLLYVQFYTNSIYTFNTDLELIKTDSTINPAVVSTTFGKTSSKATKIKNITSKQVVNRRSYIEGDILFNQSGIKSKGETLSTFRNNAVIDCYALQDMHYVGSFYIPLKGKQLFDIGILDNELIAVYATEVIKYKLPDDLYQ
jgi:hypothetical protein